MFGEEFQNVFYKNNLADGVAIMNLYMVRFSLCQKKKRMFVHFLGRYTAAQIGGTLVIQEGTRATTMVLLYLKHGR